jgi:O-antigen/teichoic acid export membrane protein
MRLKQADAAGYRARYRAAFDGMLWLGIGVATLVSVTAGFVVPLVFGERFVGAVPMLIVHVWGGVFVSMRAVLSKWIVTEGITMVSLVTHGVGAAINVGANLVLIPAYGGMGAAIATVISYATSSYLALFLWRATWPAARMMTAAWIAPVRLLVGRRRGQSQ